VATLRARLIFPAAVFELRSFRIAKPRLLGLAVEKMRSGRAYEISVNRPYSRRNGNTGKLIDWVAGETGFEVIDLCEKDISPYDYDHKNIDDDFIPLMKALLNYEQIIFVTPVYWYGPSAQMKIFIDRTSDFLDVESLKDIGRELRGKKAFVVCSSISDDADASFLNSFKDTFAYLGMEYGGYVHANCREGYLQANYEQDVKAFIGLLSA